ncbi:hypothetical protein VN97_g3277 [Penicillium thymicola]|uniref:Uncharacterized protein n=1 Tax=Penicillium thymicola TaxID=293382 RepID=A0AAI9TME5_PENTH|nr:hypothetical protein VN97_g3277 [Penicillium thymicola]
MPSFKRHDVDGMKSLSWVYMVRDYSILRIEGVGKSAGPTGDRLVCAMYTMYIGQSGTLYAMWYVVFYKKKPATTISHLNLPHIRISSNKFMMANVRSYGGPR